MSRPERMESMPVRAWHVVYQPGDGTRYGLLVTYLGAWVSVARAPICEGAGPRRMLLLRADDVMRVLGDWEPPDRSAYQTSAEQVGALNRAAELVAGENSWTTLACLIAARAALRGEL